jgi:hypothetical protein
MNILDTDDDHFVLVDIDTSVAKRLNLLDKTNRIALLQAVLYANICQ